MFKYIYVNLDFFLSDLAEGKVEYSNNDNSTTTDFFMFKVTVGGTVYVEDTLHIQVRCPYFDNLIEFNMK